MNTKIILELGCNHQGDMTIAKKMIENAKELGVYGVKIQKRNLDILPEHIKNMPRKIENSFGETYYEHRKALEFSVEQIIELKEYAENMGLVFGASVFDITSANEMIYHAHIKWIKLPSQFFDDYMMVNTLFSAKLVKKLTIIRSTGMIPMKNVLFDKYLKDFDTTMYCRSIYPFDEKEADIGSARLLFRSLPEYACGYSSHDKDGKLIPIFILLGAKVIERHYTLDKTMKGTDHSTVSSDFKDMQEIINDIKDMEEKLEYKNLDSLCSEKEEKNRIFYKEVMRRGN